MVQNGDYIEKILSAAYAFAGFDQELRINFEIVSAMLTLLFLIAQNLISAVVVLALRWTPAFF